MAVSFSRSKILHLLVLIIFLLNLQAVAQPNYPREPKEAALIYSDLLHFMDAYKALETNNDTIQVLQTLYFEKGSKGLKEFINRHQLTAERLKDAMQAHPERYALIPDFLGNITEIEALYADLMKKYHQVLPNTVFAPTYLLVGANRGIGQASQVGQLITITRVVDDRNKMQKLMTHELTHFQQVMAMGGQKYISLYTAPNNMLGMCLREGGAEFFTSLVLGDITQDKALEYIEKNKTELKKQFLTDLETQNQEFWLWASIDQNSYPKLLGYAMGYEICKEFYENSDDKNTALQDILKMEDAEGFLKSSGYFKE
jgi:hypothetical protein